MTSIRDTYNYITNSIYDNINTAPVGSVAAYWGSTDPTGWIICDGIARTNNSDGKYNALNTMGIGTGGSGTSNYSPPDFRGAFLRGDGKGTATAALTSGYGSYAATLKSSQNDTIANHTHSTSIAKGYATIIDPAHNHRFYTYNDDYNCQGGSNRVGFNNCGDATGLKYWTQFIFDSKTGTTDSGHTHGFTSANPTATLTANENRPYNYSINWILKY